jgi:large subunit ribosomal protein L4
MPTAVLHDMQGEQLGDIELNPSVFGVDVNHHLLHEAVTMYLANQRVGTASTKTRSEVRGGGRKPWRQKGTGRARAGSIRSPIWAGGGITFGPKPRDYSYSIPIKARRQALRSALSAKAAENRIAVIDELSFEEPKTRRFAALLEAFNSPQSTLVVLGEVDENTIKSARNIPNVTTMVAKDLNAYQVLRHDELLITEEGLARLEEVLAQ